MKQEFIKIRTYKDIIISSVILAAGFFQSFFTEIVPLQITGYLFIIIGVILFFTLKSRYRNVETGELFDKKVKFFDISQKSVILAALENDPKQIDMNLEGKGSGVILDIFFNQNDAYVQAYTFCSGQYEPNGEMRHFTAAQVAKMVQFRK